MSDLNAIKARLGSISPTTKRHLPPAVLKLLDEDMPILIEVADHAACFIYDSEHTTANVALSAYDRMKIAINRLGS